MEIIAGINCTAGFLLQLLFPVPLPHTYQTCSFIPLNFNTCAHSLGSEIWLREKVVLNEFLPKLNKNSNNILFFQFSVLLFPGDTMLLPSNRWQLQIKPRKEEYPVEERRRRNPGADIGKLHDAGGDAATAAAYFGRQLHGRSVQSHNNANFLD